jgi:hypothetical protein
MANRGAIAVVICELPMAGLYGIICSLKGVADCGADEMCRRISVDVKKEKERLIP